MRNVDRILVGQPEGKSHSEDLDVDGMKISKWNLRKWGGTMWTGFISPRIRTLGGIFVNTVMNIHIL
jgi:hypothetical protein